jgi:hypothetical protein
MRISQNNTVVAWAPHSEFFAVSLSATERIKKIVELIQQGPARGVIRVALHENGKREISSKFIRPYQRGSELVQIATVAESVDSYIISAYSRGDRRYDGATITVSDRPRPVTPTASSCV